MLGGLFSRCGRWPAARQWQRQWQMGGGAGERGVSAPVSAGLIGRAGKRRMRRRSAFWCACSPACRTWIHRTPPLHPAGPVSRPFVLPRPPRAPGRPAPGASRPHAARAMSDGDALAASEPHGPGEEALAAATPPEPEGAVDGQDGDPAPPTEARRRPGRPARAKLCQVCSRLLSELPAYYQVGPRGRGGGPRAGTGRGPPQGTCSFQPHTKTTAPGRPSRYHGPTYGRQAARRPLARAGGGGWRAGGRAAPSVPPPHTPACAVQRASVPARARPATDPAKAPRRGGHDAPCSAPKARHASCLPRPPACTQRYRICSEHRDALCVHFKGIDQRFCQQVRGTTLGRGARGPAVRAPPPLAPLDCPSPPELAAHFPAVRHVPPHCQVQRLAPLLPRPPAQARHPPPQEHRRQPPHELAVGRGEGRVWCAPGAQAAVRCGAACTRGCAGAERGWHAACSPRSYARPGRGLAQEAAEGRRRQPQHGCAGCCACPGGRLWRQCCRSSPHRASLAAGGSGRAVGGPRCTLATNQSGARRGCCRAS